MTLSRMTLLSALACLAPLASTQGYRRPSQVILDVLNAPPTPGVSISPTRDTMLLTQGSSYPEIEELAAPILRIAGLRLDPATSGPQSTGRVVAMTLKDIRTGRETSVSLPRTGRVGGARWSPNGRSIAFTNTLERRIELWVADAGTGRSRAIRGVTLNAAYGTPVQWMPDSRTLLVQLVPRGRGAMPPTPRAPGGTSVLETTRRASPERS